MNTCQKILHAASIVTQDDARHIYHQASLAIHKGRIAAVGPRQEVCACWQAEEELDLGNVLVLPGLVNAHSHVPMTYLRGLADDLPLMEWLQTAIFPVESHLTERMTALGTLLGCAEMLRTGTTAMLDMYYFPETVLDVVDKVGLRCACGTALVNFPAPDFADPQQGLRHIYALAEKYAGHDRLSLTVCPHAVYTTTPDLLKDCLQAARKLHLPLHMHLAESATETETCLQMQGKRPIPYVRDLGLLDHPISLAHVVDTTDAELDMLAASKAVVLHNPSSNMKLASGTARIQAMLDRGIPLALGTDGAASNNRLNMFTEMGRAALLQKVQNLAPTALPAQSVLDMATRGGALAMHDPRLGSLAVGQAADCIALDLNEAHMQPLYNEVSHLVYAATGMENRMTMVAGEILYKDCQYLTLDYPALLQDIASLREEVLPLTAKA